MMREHIVPCKINLGLEVLFKRPDGYHELSTVFYRVLEPHDVITVTESDSFRFTCSDHSLATDTNLVMKAADAWRPHLDCDFPSLHIHLEKRIPMGAGLGGGSSDAATILQILNEIHPVAPKELSNIARSIGADVPFFLSNSKAALATGIGEVLTPIKFDLNGVVLIVYDPAIQVSTRDAYAGLALQENPIVSNVADVLSGLESLDDLNGNLRNDFEPSVFAKFPKLASIKQTLYDSGASVALMSGSGSAIFGIFNDYNIAHEAKSKFERENLLAFLS
jgi:4-diphosphocytidyl-2-C-methyl-D-erythritol kinase